MVPLSFGQVQIALTPVSPKKSGVSARKRGRKCSMRACRQRTKRGATSTRGDELRVRLRAELARKRSMRTRYGRRPAVFRQMRHPDTALARELFKPASAPRSEALSEYLAHSGSEGLRGMLTRLLASVVSEGVSAGLEAAAEEVVARAVSTLLPAAEAGAATDAAVDPPAVASGRCAGVARCGRATMRAARASCGEHACMRRGEGRSRGSAEA